MYVQLKQEKLVVLKEHDNGLVKTYLPDQQAEPLTIIRDKAPAVFHGHKIQIETVWAQIIKFFLDHPKNEVQVRGFHHPDLGWKFHAFPQEYPSGMSTKELENHENFQEDRKTLFGGDWTCFCTVHHHCSMEAFQSGTDSKDEDHWAGLHITLGNLDEPQLDWHHRFSFANQYMDVNLFDWFTTSKFPELAQLPGGYGLKVLMHMLTDPTNKAEYPKRWKENLIKPKLWVTGKSSKQKTRHDYWNDAAYFEKGIDSYDSWDDRNSIPADDLIAICMEMKDGNLEETWANIEFSCQLREYGYFNLQDFIEDNIDFFVFTREDFLSLVAKLNIDVSDYKKLINDSTHIKISIDQFSEDLIDMLDAAYTTS